MFTTERIRIMDQYILAGLRTSMTCKYEIMQRRSAKYLAKDIKTPDITLENPDASLTKFTERHPNLTLAEAELILMTSRFAKQLLFHEGFILHASAVAFRQRGVLFSADSGVGKSTHTRLWQKHFGRDAVPIINDDKPALRLENGRFYVYGNPFSGNSEENCDLKVPLHAIVFLQRDATNSIRPLTVEEALPLLLRQTPRYTRTPEAMEHLLSLLDTLFLTVPAYQLCCNIEESAAILAAATLFPAQN